MTRPLPEIDDLVGRSLAAAGIDCRRFRLLELVRNEVDADARALLVFADDASVPALFVKLAWGQRGAALEIEHANLGRLSASQDDVLRASVPRPWLLERRDAFSALAVTALPFGRMKDRPPQAYFRSASFGRHLDAVTDWLARFHRAVDGSVRDVPLDPAGDVETFRGAYRRSPELDRLLDESVERLLSGLPAPSPCHGDFCSANLLVAPDDTIRVVDWEWPTTGGWPIGDFLHFASSVWCAPYGKGPQAREASLEQFYFESTPLTDRLVSAAHALAADLQIGKERLLPLSVLAWTAFANRKSALVGAAGLLDDDVAAGHLPLVVVRDGHCRNLELLAARSADYRIGRC